MRKGIEGQQQSVEDDRIASIQNVCDLFASIYDLAEASRREKCALICWSCASKSNSSPLMRLSMLESEGSGFLRSQPCCDNVCSHLKGGLSFIVA
jgi:hypothetical protein